MPVRFLLLLLSLLVAGSADATYLNSNKQNFGSGSSTSCNPNPSLTVSVGQVEYISAQSNSTTPVSVTSPRVSAWTTDQNDAGSGIRHFVAHGTVTSSGAESITVALGGGGGSALMGSGCALYSAGTVFNTTGTGITNSASISVLSGTDVVAVGFSSTSVVTLDAPFTTRQSIQFGGTTFMVFGDYSPASSGTVTANTTSTSGNGVVVIGSVGVPSNGHNRGKII